MTYKNNKAVSFFKALLLVSVVLLAGVCTSQTTINNRGYKIRIQIKGIADTVCYLANYFGDKTYLTDTATVDVKGKFIFEGDTALPGGIYIVAGQSNNKYFELIIDREQKFTAETDISDVSGKINFENSPDNTLFFGFIEYNMKVKKEIELLRKSEDMFADLPDSLKAIAEQIKGLNLDLEIHQKNIVVQHPESFVAVILEAMMDPEITDIPVLENGREDSIYAFRQFKEHYWDNFNLSDDRLLRTPIFHKRLERYFRDMVYQHPDSINREADLFISKTKANREVFKYVVWYLTYKYETSKIMGFDEIFVHMIDSYYATGEAFWTDSTTLKALVKHADALRPILIGNQAPELILLDTSGSFQSLYHVSASYTVVFFYESDCSHCKKEIKELKDWYGSNDTGAEVFAVCTDTSLVKWKKFIRDFDLNWVNVNGTRSITRDYHDLYDINMTPALFVLDENKYIIAKRLKAEQLKTFLQNYNNNPEMHIKY
jgi:peroxiredoxin/CBS domain-containing protein